MLGVAAINWMSRGNRIGGIYSRPLAVGNLLLFVTAALSLVRFVAGGRGTTPLITATIVLTILGGMFAWLVFAPRR